MTRPREAAYVCDEAIRHFSEPETPVLVHVVADAFYLKGGAMLELKRPIEALPAFAEALKRTPEAERSAIPGLQAKALLGRGLAFDRLGQFPEALAAYDEVATRFGKSKNLVVQGPVASALARKVPILDGDNRTTEARAVHEELVQRLGQSAPAYHELVKRSLVDRADFELICGRNESADRNGRDRRSTAVCRIRLRADCAAHIIRAKANIADGNAESIRTGHHEHVDDIGKCRDGLQGTPSCADGTQRRTRRTGACGNSSKLRPQRAFCYPFRRHWHSRKELQPRVAREVEEVATDIRKELNSIREGRGLRTLPLTGMRTRAGSTAQNQRNRHSRQAEQNTADTARIDTTGGRGQRQEEKSNSWKVWMEEDGEIYVLQSGSRIPASR